VWWLVLDESFDRYLYSGFSWVAARHQNFRSFVAETLQITAREPILSYRRASFCDCVAPRRFLICACGGRDTKSISCTLLWIP